MKPALRKASEFRIDKPHQAGQAHRAAAGAMIDYRLQEITDQLVRAISTVPGNFVDKPGFKSPWHYHDCEMQIAVVLDGSVELGYRGDTYARAVRGDILFIPGQTMHDVGAPSPDYQIAEITFPGTFGTVEAPMPPRDHLTPAATLGPRDAIRSGTTGGLATYRYALPAPYDRRYGMRGLARSRTHAFEPRARVADGRFAMTVCTDGWLDTDAGRLERGDLLVLPGGAEVAARAVSDDFAAVEVVLL